MVVLREEPTSAVLRPVAFWPLKEGHVVPGLLKRFDSCQDVPYITVCVVTLSGKTLCELRLPASVCTEDGISRLFGETWGLKQR